jgi:hypothetical protein
MDLNLNPKNPDIQMVSRNTDTVTIWIFNTFPKMVLFISKTIYIQRSHNPDLSSMDRVSIKK